MDHSSTTGRGHLIEGDWAGNDETFLNAPVSGEASAFPKGTPDLVDRAAKAAEAAFPAYSATTRAERAAFLRRIADEIEARGAAITAMGTAETGLPAARLEGERGRTCGQLRLFADHIEAGDYLDRRHDTALPDRAPLPRPDLRLIQRPIGPVAVFGASNFPLAFSTAGGDTASALAAGCTVVVKGHPGHPGTSEIVADAIRAAIEACGMPAGTFSLVQDGGPGRDGADSREVGAALVQHPAIKAVGFTGSLRGGRALFDLASQRDEPIPFFGELGSINPVFVMPEAASARGAAIASGWVGSLTMGAGQFCTNPGIVVIPAGKASAFAEAVSEALAEAGEQTMLTPGIASAYGAGVSRVSGEGGVRKLVAGAASERGATAAVFSVSGETWLANPALAHEVFGPAGIIVESASNDETQAIAEGLDGQLTATLQLDDGDVEAARPLVAILERKAGRILANGFPTGVEVADAMMHGGPWPASTNASTTSVGTLAIRRFLRPVSYQNMPEALLPEDLR
ncbi:MAG: aldehyde dehydrogenase (NADP(+)) [Pseudomonadota bacterium]